MPRSALRFASPLSIPTVEAGYLWSPALDLKLPPTGNAPVRTAPVTLNELALSGLSFGAAFGVGY